MIDRVEVLVTRWRKDAVLTLTDIESVLGMPIAQSLSGDAKGTYQALANAISEAADKPVRSEIALEATPKKERARQSHAQE